MTANIERKQPERPNELNVIDCTAMHRERMGKLGERNVDGGRQEPWPRELESTELGGTPRWMAREEKKEANRIWRGK